MKHKKQTLEDLKKDYVKYQKKYKLPSFQQLNEDFSIERIVEVETDYLLREIRKTISDKLFNYLRFVEGILNPVNAPMFVFSIIKALTENEKQIFSEMYKKLAKMEIQLFEIDISYDEKKEADFIKQSYKLWQEIKKDASDVTAVIRKNWENKSDIGFNGKGYFG